MVPSDSETRLFVRSWRPRGTTGQDELRGETLWEAVQRGNLRVSIDGNTLPQSRRVTIAINRHGRIDSAGLPLCSIERIQPATIRNALQVCGPAVQTRITKLFVFVRFCFPYSLYLKGI
ncbi:MAG TPA: hypothetical protein VFI03_08975 [Solirubrobacterales bacterium]|nr:hypothetical protein [Solirubrobacterales bacterium]